LKCINDGSAEIRMAGRKALQSSGGGIGVGNVDVVEIRICVGEKLGIAAPVRDGGIDRAEKRARIRF
jgi:hypothetical protein